MKTVKVSELKGSELDWAVARAIGAESIECDHDNEEISVDLGHTKYCTWEVSCDWEQCGPLIERLVGSGFEISPCSINGFRASNYTDEGLPRQGWDSPEVDAKGSSIMVAACRAIVAVKFGDTMEVPGIMW